MKQGWQQLLHRPATASRSHPPARFLPRTSHWCASPLQDATAVMDTEVPCWALASHPTCATASPVQSRVIFQLWLLL